MKRQAPSDFCAFLRLNCLGWGSGAGGQRLTFKWGAVDEDQDADGDFSAPIFLTDSALLSLRMLSCCGHIAPSRWTHGIHGTRGKIHFRVFRVFRGQSCLDAWLRLRRPGLSAHNFPIGEQALKSPRASRRLPGLRRVQYSSLICLSPCSGLGMSLQFLESTTKSRYSSGIWPSRFGTFSPISTTLKSPKRP